MAESKIEWTDATWNPVTGCEAVSPGCAHCYAATMTKRLAAMGQKEYAGLLNDHGHFNGVVKTHRDRLSKPLKWRKPRRVFVNSMSDLFHEAVPFSFIDGVFAAMALTERHTYQVLTKRADIMHDYMSSRSKSADYWKEAAQGLGYSLEFEGISLVKFPLPNVHLGVSAEDQQRADERIPHLLRCPAAVRFVSVQPLLGPIVFDSFARGGPPTWLTTEVDHPEDTKLDQIIVGGESGPKSRWCNIKWIRDIVHQCAASGTACFVKQLGAKPVVLVHPHGPCELDLKSKKGNDPTEWPEDLRVRQMPEIPLQPSPE